MTIGVFIALAFGVLFLSVRRTDDGLAVIPAGQAEAAPGFTLPDAATGKAVTLDAARAKGPVVISFWATWCDPCRAELPHLERVWKKYRGRAEFLGIDGSDDVRPIAEFAQRNGLTFPMLRDENGAVWGRYDPDRAIPFLAVIDRQGRIRAEIIGYDPDFPLEGRLSDVLEDLMRANR